MNIIKKLSFLLIALCFSLTASAQRFTVGTNTIDWLTLGTFNADASVAVTQHVSIHLGAELNPWTWNAGNQDKQFQIRHVSYWVEGRWWPWYVYSGWWFGGDIRYSMYNIGGILSRNAQEGDAYGIGGYAGYSIMLNDHWNLDLGGGLWGGWTKYTRYACPLCGVRTDQGSKAFILPDLRVAFQLVF